MQKALQRKAASNQQAMFACISIGNAPDGDFRKLNPKLGSLRLMSSMGKH
ncbi:hypothetical protein G7A66_12185 [Altererythrobacter sp. SALINAS58]|nr:hypothetical protein [Alteripontixanthobacter muriae]NTZ43829.1 hypothetical protein [Alteripontixanthobacter muriae]